MSILTNTYYGNTVQEWATALIIILCAILIGKTLYWATTTVIKKITSKTKTKLDDILVDMMEEPIILALTIAAIWFSLKTLTISEGWQAWINNIFMFMIVINVAWLITRLFDALFEEYFHPIAKDRGNDDLADHLLPVARKGLKAIVWVIAIVIGLNNAGYDVGALLAGLGIGGIALAMAAKDTIANIFGGFTIFADKPFKMKNRVKIDGYDGFIQEIGIRSTRLKTFDGTIVTIPNSKFTDSPVENVTIAPSKKVTNTIGLIYDTTPAQMDKAMKLLHKINEKCEGTTDKALISFTEFADSSMNILFIYYIKNDADYLATKNDMNMGILKEFNKAKLEMAFPTRTVYNKKG